MNIERFYSPEVGGSGFIIDHIQGQEVKLLLSGHSISTNMCQHSIDSKLPIAKKF
jgi:hypothetical protein